MWVWVRFLNDGKWGVPSGGSSWSGTRSPPGQKNIGAPDLIGGQIVAVRLQHVAAIQFDGKGFFLKLLLPGRPVETWTRIRSGNSGPRGDSALSAGQGLLDLLRLLQTPFVHPPLIAPDPPAGALRVSLGSLDPFPPVLAEAENVDLFSLGAPFDLYPGFLLKRIARGRLTPDFLPALLFFKIIQPLVAFRLPPCHDIVQYPRARISEILLIGHSTIHHHGRSRFLPRSLLQKVHHLFNGLCGPDGYPRRSHGPSENHPDPAPARPTLVYSRASCHASSPFWPGGWLPLALQNRSKSNRISTASHPD